MKKKNLKAKLNLNKETISNLNDIKGGSVKATTAFKTECMCAVTMQRTCDCISHYKTCDCFTLGDECCTEGTSKIICC